MKVHKSINNKLLMYTNILVSMSVRFEIKFVMFVAEFSIIKLLLLPDIISNVPSGH